MENLTQLYDPEIFRARGHALVDRLADHLGQSAEANANPRHDPGVLLDKYRRLRADGTDPAALFEQYLNDAVRLHSPRYVGHQMNPPAPLTALADLTNGVVNGSTAIFEMGGPGVVMERLVIDEFAEMLGLDPATGGFLTNGGTLANLTALLAARAARWPAAGGDPWQTGNGDHRPCVLVNEQAHYCIDRAVRIMGWGADGIINVPADGDFRMRTELLDERIADARDRGLTPVALVGSAGTTSTGSFDDLTAIAEAAERHGLWFHVDGAHGAPLRLDAARAHHAAGLERADSLIMDFHKMLMCPSLTTGVFFRRGTDAYRTFYQKADYLLSFNTDAEDWSNFGRRTFECTKNMMSLRVFSLLAAHGRAVFVDYVSRVNDVAERFAARVRASADFELALAPTCNIVCFRYRPPGGTHDAAAVDHLNALLRAQIIGETDFYLVQTRLNERTYLRCTFTNPFTQAHHDAALLDALRTGAGRWAELRDTIF